MKKKSLRVKLTLILLAFVLLIMTCTIIISNVFLGDYYIYSKQKALVKAFSDINNMYKASEIISDGENVKPFYDINEYSASMVMPEDVERTAYIFDLLLGDDLAGRKSHIADNGHKYLELADIS